MTPAGSIPPPPPTGHDGADHLASSGPEPAGPDPERPDFGGADFGDPDLGGIVERYDHVALAVFDIEPVLALIRLLGGKYRTGDHHRSGGFRWLQFDLPGSATLELISPLDPDDADNFLVRFLATRGEGPHHVTFKVADLDAAAAAAERQGYEVVGRDDSDPEWKEAFLHPRSSHGLLIQFAEFDEVEPSGEGLSGPAPGSGLGIAAVLGPPS